MEVITHRGQVSTEPENTIPAFIAALNQGYGIEVDLRSTADGEIVVSHDRSLERVAGVDENISDLTLEEAKALQTEPGTSETGFEIPTLREVLGTFVKNRTTGSHLALHLKGSGWDERINGVLDALSVYNEKTTADLFELTFVFDVKVNTAQRFVAAEPSIQVGLSIGESDYFPTDSYPTIYRYNDVRDLKCWDIVWADEWQGGLYTAEFVESVHADDRLIICVSPELHTTTDPSHPQSDSPVDVWKQLIEFNVDGICTDFPTELRTIEMNNES